MFFNHIKKMVPYITVAIFLVVIDRFFKTLAFLYLQNEKIEIIGDLLQLKFVKNFYIAFSIPISGLILNIFIFILILVILILTIKLVKKRDYYIAGYLTVLLVGAISNILDRFKYGYVIDYIDLKWFTVFNIADMMIVGSVIFIMFIYIKDEKHRNL